VEDSIMSKQPKMCRVCREGEMKTATETHLYVESGLPNVVLVGVDVRRCAKCGAFEVLLPRVAELHRVIAKAVIHKPAHLSGAEVKFLRKHLGWSGTDFAAHMGVDPTTVSAWENERKPFGTSSDRLLRLMVARQAPVEDYSLDDLTKIADAHEPPQRVEIRPKAHGWQASAA
jgi:putative zinc finger/helix-turn-helix YgiT family protein